MDRKAMLVGVGAVLAGGAAFAAWQGTRGDYAQVTEVSPVMEKQEAFAQVISATPVSDVVSVPRQLCNDVAVQRRLPERDGNAGGAIAGGPGGGPPGGGAGIGSRYG